MGSGPGVLGGLAVGAVAAVSIIVPSLGGGSAMRRLDAAPDAPAAPLAHGTRTSPHRRPDLADYNVIVGERRMVRGAAVQTHRTIVSCRAQTPAPFTSGLRSFNECASLPLRQNIYRARIEGALLAIGLQNLAAGSCRAQAQGVGADLSDLGDLSQGWFDLYEQGRADLVGSELASLRRATRSTIGELLDLTASVGSATPSRELMRACRPRPYDRAEHVSGAWVLGQLQASRLRLHA